MDFGPKGRWYTAKKVLFALSGASTLLSTSFVILAAEFSLKFGMSPQNISKAFAGTDMVSRGDASSYRFRIIKYKKEAMPWGKPISFRYNTTTWHYPTQGNAMQSGYPATVNAMCTDARVSRVTGSHRSDRRPRMD